MSRSKGECSSQSNIFKHPELANVYCCCQKPIDLREKRRGIRHGHMLQGVAFRLWNFMAGLRDEDDSNIKGLLSGAVAQMRHGAITSALEPRRAVVAPAQLTPDAFHRHKRG